MSESIDKFTPLSKRHPENRRSRSRRVKRSGQGSSSLSRRKPIPPSKVSSLARPTVRTHDNSSYSVPVVKTSRTVRRKINPSQVRSQSNHPQSNRTQTHPQLKRIRRPPTGKKITLSKRTRLKPGAKVILYALRLLIVGVGIGAIVGTILSLLDPSTRIESAASQASVKQQSNSRQTSNNPVPSILLTQEIIPLKAEISNIFQKYPELNPGVFVLDLDNGTYVNLKGSTMFPTASTIKIPILVAFYQYVEEGKIRLEEPLTMTKDDVATGSGNMQYEKPGIKFSAIQVADKMMTISDNTATNMLIARMGGAEELNKRFQSWGLRFTRIRNKLPDIEGTNISSPSELAQLMAKIEKGELVSRRSRDGILDIMRRNTRRHLLPVGIGKGATVFNKTGNIGKMIGDVGLVYLPSGKRYIISAMVVRPRNSKRAEKFINSVSKSVYTSLSQSTGTAPSIGNPGVPRSGTNSVNNFTNYYYQQPSYVNPGNQYTNRVSQPSYQQPNQQPNYQQPNYQTPGTNTRYYYPNSR